MEPTTLKTKSISPSSRLPKSPTGIQGLDEITGGGLPEGRPTLICGSAGSGKTMLAVEFLVRGATMFGEPGVFMMFEETRPNSRLMSARSASKSPRPDPLHAGDHETRRRQPSSD